MLNLQTIPIALFSFTVRVQNIFKWTFRNASIPFPKQQHRHMQMYPRISLKSCERTVHDIASSSKTEISVTSSRTNAISSKTNLSYFI